MFKRNYGVIKFSSFCNRVLKCGYYHNLRFVMLKFLRLPVVCISLQALLDMKFLLQ